MIEFIIVAPLVLLLLLAISEFGHALYQYNALTKSVRDGGRYLSEIAMLGITGSIVISPTDITETQNLVVYGNSAGNGTPKLPGLAPSQVTVPAWAAAFCRVSSMSYRPSIPTSRSWCSLRCSVWVPICRWG
jgi:hypothetical protein